MQVSGKFISFSLLDHHFIFLGRSITFIMDSTKMVVECTPASTIPCNYLFVQCVGLNRSNLLPSSCALSQCGSQLTPESMQQVVRCFVKVLVPSVRSDDLECSLSMDSRSRAFTLGGHHCH